MPFCPRCGGESSDLAVPCPDCEGVYTVADDVSRDSEDSLLGRRVADKYVVVAPVNAGAMGAVYRALQQPVDRVVALKVLQTDLEEDDETRRRFEREARAVSQIRHPNVITLHDFGFDDATPYMVIEFVPGRDLGEWLREESPDLRRTIDLFRRLLSALAEAHDRGIVHRDLKPANVLVTESGDEPDWPKVLDFGIARLVNATEHAELTTEGEVYGTPHFMSPEQARGDTDVGPRADVYSAGIVLYELLSGHPPFEADSPLPILRQHCSDPLPPLEPRDGITVPDELTAFLEKATRKERRKRFADARAMLETFGALDDPERSGIMEMAERKRILETAEEPSPTDERAEDGEIPATHDTDTADGKAASGPDAPAETARRAQPPPEASHSDEAPTDGADEAGGLHAKDLRDEDDERRDTSDNRRPNESSPAPSDARTESEGEPEPEADATGDAPRLHSGPDYEPEGQSERPEDVELDWQRYEEYADPEKDRAGQRRGAYSSVVGRLAALIAGLVGSVAAVVALFAAYVALAAQWHHVGAVASLVAGLAPTVVALVGGLVPGARVSLRRLLVAGLLSGILGFAGAHYPDPGRLASRLEAHVAGLPGAVERLPGGTTVRDATHDAIAAYARWLESATE